MTLDIMNGKHFIDGQDKCNEWALFTSSFEAACGHMEMQEFWGERELCLQKLEELKGKDCVCCQRDRRREIREINKAQKLAAMIIA